MIQVGDDWKSSAHCEAHPGGLGTYAGLETGKRMDNGLAEGDWWGQGGGGNVKWELRISTDGTNLTTDYTDCADGADHNGGEDLSANLRE